MMEEVCYVMKVLRESVVKVGIYKGRLEEKREKDGVEKMGDIKKRKEASEGSQASVQ